METVRSLLAQGNDKLSEAIFHFDLPSVETCPGASELCQSKCYACKGRFHFPQVQERLKWCYAMSRKRDFADQMIRTIRKKGAAFVLRLHCSGDFYSAAYVKKWLRIVKACSTTKFFGYTRSWRDPKIEPYLRELAACDNVRLFYSVDQETGTPVEYPETVRLAWMQVDVDEEIPPWIDLVFRDYPLRHLPAHPQVCPYDSEVGRKAEINCGRCGRCWQ